MPEANSPVSDDQTPTPDRVWELCEFFILGFDVARLLYGEDGRPLGERYAAARVREGVVYEMRRCPYPGSRSGRDMNVAALRSVQADWPDILEGAAEVREAFYLRYGHEELDWRWVWLLGRALTTAPTLYARRSGDGSRTVVPRRLAGLYKPSLGLAMTPEYVVLAGGEHGAAVDPDVFYRETEDRRVFLTPDAACSGPMRHVRDFLEVCLGPRRTPHHRWVRDLVDLDDLLSYSWANVDLELAKYRFLLSVASRGGTDWRQLSDSTPPPAFEGRPLVELADELDELVVEPGFSARTVELGRSELTSLPQWTELFAELMTPVLGLACGNRPRPELRPSDLRLMVRHLCQSWRSSGVDMGIQLARVSIPNTVHFGQKATDSSTSY